MGMSVWLLLGMAGFLVAGVGVSLVVSHSGQRYGDGTVVVAAKPQPAKLEKMDELYPLPVFVACAVPLIAFVFYLALGYPWLEGIIGVKVVERLFWLLHLAAPAAGALVCAAYYIASHARLRFFLALWLNLMLGVLGLLAWKTGIY